MMSCCCSDSRCSWEPIRSRNLKIGEKASGDVSCLVDEEELQTESTAEWRRMDIELLREQYRCTREKQKRETQVVLFKQAPVLDTGGDSLVSVVPVIQRKGGSPERCGALPGDPQFPSSTHLERGPWHTHLGMHRRTCLANGVPTAPHTCHPCTPSAASSTPCSSRSPSLSDDHSQGSVGELTPSGASTPGSSVELDSGLSEGSNRKFSAPAVLSRQLSFGGQHHRGGLHPLTLSCSAPHHYPFPQRKTLRKSEAAKRLGMYSSF